MAHKKGLGSSRNGRDSNAKRLGVKVFAGQTVSGGEIIVRQRGSKFKAGDGVVDLVHVRLDDVHEHLVARLSWIW